MIKEKAARLINVKSIVTILLSFVFMYLSVTEVISGSEFMTVFTTVIGCYFGSQLEKKKGEEKHGE